MKTVIFKTKNAVFEFSRNYVIEHLNALFKENSSDEINNLSELIKHSNEETILIPQEHIYIVLDLIAAAKGTVTCKICDKPYDISELESFALGAGKNPLSPNIKISRRHNLFHHEKRNPSLLGGEGYRCPASHELIMLITWRT